MWMSTLRKNDFHFSIIIWKYFLYNINEMFEYSVLDKIRLDCMVYPSHTHTQLASNLTLIQNKCPPPIF